MKFGLTIALAAATALLFGCSPAYEKDEILRIGYTGDLMELPLFTAYNEGYFAEDGLSVELVRLERRQVEDYFKSGDIDAFTCDAAVFPWIQEGTALRIGAGLCCGSVEIITSLQSGINDISGLKNRKIGVYSEDDSALPEADRLLEKHGVDSIAEVEWVFLNKDESVIEALSDNKIDGAVVWKDTVQYDANAVQVLYRTEDIDKQASGHNHAGHSETYFYRNFIGISAELTQASPEKSKTLLRQWMLGADTVEADKGGALEQAIENGYITTAENPQILKSFMWMPGVNAAKDNIKRIVHIQKSTGVLPEELDEDAFFEKAFIPLLPSWD